MLVTKRVGSSDTLPHPHQDRLPATQEALEWGESGEWEGRGEGGTDRTRHRLPSCTLLSRGMMRGLVWLLDGILARY